jgi:hypothetical protein
LSTSLLHPWIVCHCVFLFVRGKTLQPLLKDEVPARIVLTNAANLNSTDDMKRSIQHALQELDTLFVQAKRVVRGSRRELMLMWISRGFLDWATTAADKSAGGSEEVAMGGTPNSDRWQRQAES